MESLIGFLIILKNNNIPYNIPCNVNVNPKDGADTISQSPMYLVPQLEGIIKNKGYPKRLEFLLMDLE